MASHWALAPTRSKGRVGRLRRRLALVVLATLSAGLLSTVQSGTPARAQERRFTAGQLLVAAPAMRDPRFARSVVLMVEHNGKGAYGFVVNKRMGQRPIAQVLRAMGRSVAGVTGDLAIHWGGPVGRNVAVVIHSREYRTTGTEPVAGGYALTRNAAVIQDIGRGKGPRQHVFVTGYAGWATGQLERELAAGHWVVIRAEASLVFSRDLGTVWERAFKKRGLDL